MFALSTPVVLWAAWPFHRAAFQAARHGGTTMDTLVSLGVLAAYLWSVVAIFSHGHVYFEVAVTVTTFLLAGRYAESRAKDRAGLAVTALLKLGVKEATVLRDGQEVQIPISALTVGDEFVVRPGERIATDAVVIAGTSSVDNALITGESVPVEVGPGGPGDRCRRESDGSAHRAGQSGRGRHRTRPDRGCGGTGADRQGARSGRRTGSAVSSCPWCSCCPR